MIAANAGELIDLLAKFNRSDRVLTIEPPFDGVKLVQQGDGSILICRSREHSRGTAKAVATVAE